jgi:hypothetical protein
LFPLELLAVDLDFLFHRLFGSRENVRRRDVLSLALVVAAIALPDSINPSLILTDIYLAAGPRPRRRTLTFAIAVFAVTFFGGALVALGLADLVRSLLPKLSAEIKYGLIIAGGVSISLGGIAIWIKRRSLAGRQQPKSRRTGSSGQSTIVLGAGIAGVELLTAFPYFAAISIIVGSGVTSPEKLLLLCIYNLVYILPLIGIAVVCAVMGPGAAGFLSKFRDRVLSRWPVVVAPLAVVVGLGLAVFGGFRLTTI